MDSEEATKSKNYEKKHTKNNKILKNCSFKLPYLWSNS